MPKVLISLPDDLLDEIDRAAARTGMTRSAYLQAATREALSVSTHAHIGDAVERGRQALAGVRAFETAALIRRDRDERGDADRHL